MVMLQVRYNEIYTKKMNAKKQERDRDETTNRKTDSR